MTKSEIEKQKSLALAELMDIPFVIPCESDEYVTFKPTSDHIQREFGEDVQYKPYSDDEEGYAQFAAILLKFPEVMACQFRLVSLSSGSYFSRDVTVKPTQANILDEILRMKGKWQEEWND